MYVVHSNEEFSLFKVMPFDLRLGIPDLFVCSIDTDRKHNFSAQYDIIRCFNNFFPVSLSADWDHQLKNKTKQKQIQSLEKKKNPPKKINKIVSALLLHLTNVVKSSKNNFHLYFLSVAFQLHQEKS